MATRTVFGALTAMLLALAYGSNGAHAQQGTEAQRQACMPDAFRLCSQFIPDAGRIESCLRSAGPRLSPACYVVFYPPQPAAPQGTMALRSSRQPPPPPVTMPTDDDD